VLSAGTAQPEPLDRSAGPYTFIGVLPSFMMLPLPKREFTSFKTVSSALACNTQPYFSNAV
jgi:hypothetical protein